MQFDYDKAFSRNFGWLRHSEQKILKELHIGIVGAGGVGGHYAEVLARLGVGRFTIYDGDEFSVENSNRQNQCMVPNYGKNKAEVIGQLIKDINPTAQVNINNRFMKAEDVPAFCSLIDIYLDSIDFFEIDIRILIFKKMRELKKNCLTVAPIGTGAACLVFTPDSMSFDDYFGFHTTTDVVRRANMFVTGISPSLQQARYLVERGSADFENKKAPSLPMGVYACASVAATTILKLALGRGKVLTAPRGMHFDPYNMKLIKKTVCFGYRNPLQKLKVWIMGLIYSKKK